MSTLFGKKTHNRREKASAKRKHEDISAATTSSSVGNLNHEKTTRTERDDNTNDGSDNVFPSLSPWATFEDLGLAEPLVETCKALGFKSPTPVQRQIIPFLIREQSSHVLALAETGSGKTAAFALPLLHHLAKDPYGIFGVIVSPTRELAKQIHQQLLALGSSYNVESALVVGGMDMVQQACALDRKPHFIVATPGRLAELLRGPNPPHLRHVRFLVLDEADRLLASNSGFERDVAELLLHCNRDKRTKCQTLLFSATMTRSLESIEEIAGAGKGRLPMRKFVIRDDSETKSQKNVDAKRQEIREMEEDHSNSDSSEEKESDSADEISTDGERDSDSDDEDKDASPKECNESESPQDSAAEKLTPRIPAGLKQEYVFMPSRVRDAYLLTTIRTLLSNGGRAKDREGRNAWRGRPRDNEDVDEDNEEEAGKARSTIVFVATCERAALVSEILAQVGVDNVALHSLLSQNRRLAALAKFKSQQVRVLVATDIASRGLDVPSVDLVINSELPRNPVNYVHRVGRTARAGRRGRAISLVSEVDVSLVHAAENITGRPLEKCSEVTDDDAIRMLGPVTKASRLAKMKLMDIGFDELLKKFKERKVRDRKERQRIEKALRKQAKKQEE
ncbi:DNA/RNA helicase, superfamily II, SNF2 family protein [Nitzschia inconspicua]|uniref:DNA/RNA helicase, superfamily II, SNF2 family protein n=1 Tax=Nitzschia inconspicua TaxID=303405 RepID=A0A9K3PWF3_9STRA|nr:DNA/RNA helicase, superfamily II, SNF2 family protein [Nitzschia inconspicua]